MAARCSVYLPVVHISGWCFRMAIKDDGCKETAGQSRSSGGKQKMKLKVCALAASAAVIGMLLAAGAAYADDSTYLNQMHQPNMVIGVAVTDNQLLQLGYAVCNAMANGQTLGQSHNTVAYTAVGMGLSPNMATVNSIVNQADSYLC